MKLTVRNPEELSSLKENDEITFLLHATETTHWIDTIQRIGATIGPKVKSSQTATLAPELKPGDLMPDFEMTSETGERVHLSDFRGQTVAFTFIFTRCPLPDYCPLMNRSFNQTRELLNKNANAPTNWQLLSISFDSEYDKPQLLAAYAQAYRGEQNDRWLFAVCSPQALKAIGPSLDLVFAQEEGSFSHNLRTVVISPSGRVHAQFDGNTWTPEALAEAMIEASTNGALRTQNAARTE